MKIEKLSNNNNNEIKIRVVRVRLRYAVTNKYWFDTDIIYYTTCQQGYIANIHEINLEIEEHDDRMFRY